MFSRLHCVYFGLFKQLCGSEFTLNALCKISNGIGHFLLTDCSVQENEEFRITLVHGFQHGI